MSIKDILQHALQDITGESFKLFKTKLCDLDVPEKIPRSKLEGKGVEEVVDLIIRTYTFDNGPKITVKVLEDIKERQASLDLKHKLENVDTTNITTAHHRRPGGYEKEDPVDSKETVYLQTTKVEDDCNPSTSKETIQVKRDLNTSKSENTPDDPPPKLTSELKNSKVSTPKCQRGKPRPDMKLVMPTKEKIEVMVEYHMGQAHTFAILLFRHFVPFSIYKKWVENTNFDGFGGKKAIPINLRNAILKEVREKFTLTPEDKKQIRRKINDLLRNPRASGWPVLI